MQHAPIALELPFPLLGAWRSALPAPRAPCASEEVASGAKNASQARITSYAAAGRLRLCTLLRCSLSTRMTLATVRNFRNISNTSSRRS
jgi:hypothetical protein